MTVLPLLLALALAAEPGAAEPPPSATWGPVGPSAAPVDLRPAPPPARLPRAPQTLVLGAPARGVAAGAGAALVCDLVFGAILAEGLSDPMFGPRSGNGGAAALGLLGLTFGTPLAVTLAARTASPDGSLGVGYLAAFGSRVAAGLASAGLYHLLLDSAPQGTKNLVVPLLFGVGELVVQPWAAAATLEGTSHDPWAAPPPSPADLARPVADPAAPR